MQSQEDEQVLIKFKEIYTVCTIRVHDRAKNGRRWSKRYFRTNWNTAKLINFYIERLLTQQFVHRSILLRRV